jgi:hypothetical protein
MFYAHCDTACLDSGRLCEARGQLLSFAERSYSLRLGASRSRFLRRAKSTFARTTFVHFLYAKHRSAALTGDRVCGTERKNEWAIVRTICEPDSDHTPSCVGYPTAFRAILQY